MAAKNPNAPNGEIPDPALRSPYSLATLSIHSDDPLNSYTDVAPALHVSTTFRYSSDPTKLSPEDPRSFAAAHAPGQGFPGDSHIYSRATAPNTSRLEAVLSSILHAPCLTYSSGLAAFHALLTYLNPKVVAIGAGYHGCHGVLQLHQKLTGCKIVDLFDESTWGELGPGDLVHLETPVNPTGVAYEIRAFAERAHKRGAHLSIDATFAPPPLMEPFGEGADFVMHSGTKYFGGHSDLLCGVIAIGTEEKGGERRKGMNREYWGMFAERIHLGSVMGSMEGWLGLRSVRTLELRVLRQSENAGRLVAWLDACSRDDENVAADERNAVKNVIARIAHASLQKEDIAWLSRQMPNGFGPVFAFWTHTPTQAKHLPSKLHLFHHATSLGGVESLIEWRRMSDSGVEENLLRVSVGVERWEDLKQDLLEGFKALLVDGIVREKGSL